MLTIAPQRLRALARSVEIPGRGTGTGTKVKNGLSSMVSIFYL